MEQKYYMPSFCSNPSVHLEKALKEPSHGFRQYFSDGVTSIVWRYPYSALTVEYYDNLFRFRKLTEVTTFSELDDYAKSAVSVFLTRLKKDKRSTIKMGLLKADIVILQSPLYFVNSSDSPVPLPKSNRSHFCQTNYVWLRQQYIKKSEKPPTVEEYEVSSRLFIYCSFLYCALYLHNQFQGARYVDGIAAVANKVICPASKKILLEAFFPEVMLYSGDIKSKRVFKQFQEKLKGDV